MGAHVRAFSILIGLLWGGKCAASQCHTITGGEITDPLIWDCGCTPGSCDSLFIEHDVTAGSSVLFVNALVSVEASGSLSSEDTLTFIGLFRNAGTVNVHRFVHPSGTFWWYNEGDVTADVLWLWGDSAINMGGIHALDTLNAGQFTRMTSYGTMDGDFLWVGQFINLDTLDFQAGQMDGFLANYNYCRIRGLFFGLSSVINEPAGFMQIDSLVALGSVHNYGLLIADSLFQLGLSNAPIGDLTDNFEPTARIECGNLKNYGHIQGFGDICVRDSTINYESGVIDHTPDICDATMTNASPPFIDVNLGTVGAGVNWCSNTGCFTAIEEQKRGSIETYPMPATTEVFLRVPRSWRIVSVMVFDAAGQLVQTEIKRDGEGYQLKRNTLPAGFYCARLVNANGGTLGVAKILFVGP